ncbi:MAG: hypothetical protein NVV59_15485 [Chitinophagaceae bacterium]|nr:hypothetical protein [Chitinophagaceae bacterium]
MEENTSTSPPVALHYRHLRAVVLPRCSRYFVGWYVVGRIVATAAAFS